MKPRTPSVKAISKAFPHCEAKLIKLLLTDDKAVANYNDHYGLCKQFYHAPDRRYARMIALNHALELFGIEHVGQEGERGFCYLNTGDSYAATLIQFDDKESIIISSWGDIVESGTYK